MEVVKTLAHSAMQVAAGVLVGTTVDTVFSIEVDQPSPSPFRLVGEVVLQLSVNALLAAGVNGLAESGNFSDPARGYAFMFCLAASQPQLLDKVQRLSGLVVIREALAYASYESNKVTKASPQAVRNANVYG